MKRQASQVIAHLRGILFSKKPNQVILDVHGVGYELNISLSTFQRMGAEGEAVSLHVYTHVREEAILLYGFQSISEKEVFLHLLTVTGVGPKLAVALLSGAPTEELIQAIRSNDLRRLVAIPGVGRKTAERIVLELRDKMMKLADAAQLPEPKETAGKALLREDLISALINLGYPRQPTEKAIAALMGDGVTPADFETLLKRALKVLAG
ncbi:MAG: Holliday junction branch migration protein RuvA [Acidobacteria bacterium]|nr:Holliday junction branch migration protein RuvA [Acidobacteriota bacterium]